MARPCCARGTDAPRAISRGCGFSVASRTRDKEEDASFLKKRSNRLLILEPRAGPSAPQKEQKFFGSFFQKRTCFLLLGAGLNAPRQF
jgi:hypothetical protein